jgi:putative spermidine/putrescine transport system substrate-binding protein
MAQYDGGLAELRAGARDWDVIDMELPDATAACREGLLQTRGALPDENDFVPGALGRCWAGSVVYSQAIAAAPGRFATKPVKLADFFDLARFPGPRALHGSAKYNLELALLADGVAPGDVYKVLSTPEGVSRALAKLDTLKGSLVWWTRSSEPAAMLTDGRAVFATIRNADIYDAATHHIDLDPIWDRQLYELDVFAVPKTSRKRAMAMDFIRFATAPERLARVAEWVPYGPARRSALSLVGRNPELGTPMRRFLPTAPENFATAFAVDDAWWQAHGAEIAPRWEAWKALVSWVRSSRHH